MAGRSMDEAAEWAIARSLIVKCCVGTVKGPVRAGCAFVQVGECLELEG